MHRTTDRFRTAALLAGLYLGALVVATPTGFSQTSLSLITSIEAPGVQTSPLVGNPEATGVLVEDFNSLPHGEQSKGFSSALGTFSGGIIQPPQHAGGAFETQFYQVASGANSETLTFNSPQRYFGLWWSDANPQFPNSNTLTFSLRTVTGLTISLPFNTGNLLTLINKQPTPSAYLGNPNPSEMVNKPTTYYAFVNFFAAAGVLINNVAFSNTSHQVTFSMDNLTIAGSYGDILGGSNTPTVPGGNTDQGPGSTNNVGGGSPVVVPPGSSVDTDPGSHVIVPGGTTVLPGATVIGNGTITTPTFDNHGIVSPGGEERAATIGTLTINGNYTQGPTGILSISANGPQCPQSDKLVINGSASLDGLLVLSSKNGFHPSSGNHYTILFASRGVTGMFAQVVDTLNTDGLTRADIFSPNGVIVAYLAGGFGALNLRSTIPIPAGSICDVNAVLVNALDPNANQLAAPFDVWISGLAQTTRFTLQDHFDDLMAAPTPPPPIAPPSGKQTVGKGVISGKEALPPPAPAPEKPHFSLWGSGFGDWRDISSEGTAHGFHYVNAGVLAGGDFHFLENYVVGLFGAYAHSGDSLLDGNTGWGGLYAGFYKRGAYILGAVYGGGGSFDTSRSTIAGGRAKGTADTQQWASFVTVGYDFRPLGKLVVGPVFSASYAYAKMDSFTEHSSFAPLRVSGSSQEDWRTDLGFRCWYGPVQIGKVGVRPFARAAWSHSYKQNLKIPVALLDFQDAATVVVSGPQLGHDFATINAGASIQWTPTISTYLSYDGQVGRDNAQSNGISGGFNVFF